MQISVHLTASNIPVSSICDGGPLLLLWVLKNGSILHGMGFFSRLWKLPIRGVPCNCNASTTCYAPARRARAAPVTLVIRKPILDNDDDDDSGDGGGGGGSSECAPSLNCHSFSHSLTYPPQFIPSSPPMLCSTIADLFSPL